MKKEPKLVYVVHEGALCHVSNFIDNPVKERPDVFCPECQSVVILKLGQQKAHHAAHKPDSLCLLTKSETVLHLNTKAYLQSQLLNARQLYINQYCTGWTAPDIGPYEGGHKACRGERARMFLWLADWDGVEVERFVESRKPDIVCYRGGRPIAAIEVLVTHAVDEQKRLDLERAGLHWLEVAADEDLYAGARKWTPDRPLPYVRCVPPLPAWTCNRCQQEPAEYTARVYEAIDKDREERRKLKEQRRAHERWRNERITPSAGGQAKSPKIEFSKILRDETGREIGYSVTQEHDDAEILLRCGDQVIATLPPPYTAQTWERLMAAYQQHRSASGVSYSDVTGWVSPSARAGSKAKGT
jgi:hypothetical protein